MASAAAAVFPQIANFNPQGFVQGNQLQQQQIGLTAAQAARQQAEVPLVQQQTQQAGLQNQLVQQQINDQKAIGAAWRDWDPTSDPSGQGLLKTAVRNGATPQSVMGVQQHLAQYNASLATADKTRLENQKMRDDDYAGKMQAIIDADPTQQEQLWQAHVADFAKDAPGEQIPAHFTAQDAKTFLNLHQFRSQQIENELKQRQAAEATARGAEATSAAAKNKAEQQKLDLINKRLEQGAHVVQPGEPHPIDGIFPASLDPPQNQYFKAAYDAGANFINPSTGVSEVQEAIVKQASEAASKIREAQNPQIIAGKAAAARAEAQATASIKMATSLAEAKALREGDNPALAGVPPALAQSTANKAMELDNSALAAKKATEDLGHFLDLAEKGNKAAGSNLSMLGAESIQALNGIKRINSTEIAGYEGAGNLLDRIKGKIGKLVEGQPVPQDVMDDIRELHQTLGTSAYQQYVSGLNALNQRSGSKYAPIVEAPNIRKGAAPTPAGNGRKLTDTNIARQYLTKAGGDKERARQLAKQDGWTF